MEMSTLRLHSGRRGYPASPQARTGPAVRHHGRREPLRQSVGTLRGRMHAQTLLCATAVTAGRPGSGAATLRARMHLMLAVSRPGSGAGTLRAGMHLMLAVSRPSSGTGTLRARMHLIIAVSRPGSSPRTL